MKSSLSRVVTRLTTERAYLHSLSLVEKGCKTSLKPTVSWTASQKDQPLYKQVRPWDNLVERPSTAQIAQHSTVQRSVAYHSIAQHSTGPTNCKETFDMRQCLGLLSNLLVTH